ncbi:MAG: AAA family ATPase [Gaiellaceae bacterium]
MVCPSCSTENPETARFCNSCGASLVAPAAPPRQERKVVTVLFADLVGFTARAEQLDPEDVQAVLAPYHAHLREELERFGGTVEKFIGDAVMALFGAPTAHEDDPERAVRAALAIRDWAADQDELQVRIAVNTGEALVALGARTAEGEGMAAGDVVNTASRLQSAAPVNGILVGETTYRATKDVIVYRDAEPVDAKGKAEPIAVWEPLEARSRYGVDLGQARSPLVGRERELDALRAALERARSQNQLQLVTLVGVPGIGKSRLVHELFRSIEAEPEFTTWRQGRSLPYGEGVSFWALAEIVKAQAGILESDPVEEVERKLRKVVDEIAADAGEADWMAARLGSLVGLQGPEDGHADPGESFGAWRGFLEGLSERHPVVLVFEDLHWADDGLLDFVDELVDWARGARLLLLCTARPELLERRPGWGGGKANASTISLPPLGDDETARLFSALLEKAVLPAETQAVLLARAAGNPLYAEQYARMLAERGDGDDLPLPETVQGIIAARLDGLSDAEKTLLQNAAVVGKVFWLGAVAAIGGIEPREAEAALRGLERKELIQRARRSSVEGEGEYAFAHLLVRDVAYGQIPRGARADRHQVAAEWIESLGRSEDQAEMLAHHYSSALEYLHAAGRDTSHLVDRARIALREAGERAEALAAWPAASRYYAAALELWPAGDPELPQVRFRCGRAEFNADGTGLDLVQGGVDELEAAGETEAAAEAAVIAARIFWSVGDVDRHDELVRRAVALVGDRDDSPARVYAMAALAAKKMFDGRFAEALESISEAMPAAERLSLGEVRVRLLNLRGHSRSQLGDDGGFDDLEQSIALASEIHAFDQLHSVLNNVLTIYVARGQLEKARETFTTMKENIERHPTVSRQRWVLNIGGDLNFMAGNWAEAMQMLDKFIAESEAGSAHYLESPTRLIRGEIRLATGDLAGASEDTEKALELARKGGEGQLMGVALLGRALVLLEEGRGDDAAALVAEVLELGDRLVRLLNDTMIVEGAWVMRALGREDEYATLLAGTPEIRWAGAAAAICSGAFLGAAALLEQIGYRPGEAYARLQAARQLVEQGRRAEADAELHSALAFYREVGATRYVREGEALLAASA